jgi:RND family efflux transporter MFP subunit
MSRRTLAILVAVTAGVAVVLALTVGRSTIRQWLPAEHNTVVPSSDAKGSTPPMSHEPMPDVTARGAVTLDTRRQQLIGVRTAPVVRGPLGSETRVPGIVQFDETRQAEVNTQVDGWIRELFADYTGKPVRKGDPLFTLYSPELVTTQREFLLALRGHSQAAGAEVAQVREYSERLLQAARARLARWDMSAEDIAQLEQRGQVMETITVRSSISGVIVEKQAVQGMRVMAGQALFRVADLSSVWVEANVPEQDVASVRVGQTATITLDAFPGESFAGRATYVDTAMDEATRTLKVRFQAANGRGRLRPGMYANVEIRGAAAEGLTVPSDAVLDSGAQQVVFVAEGDGLFTPRTVKVGRRTAQSVEVLEGLTEGEQVATGATFFLDSESQLRAGLQNYQPSSAMPTGAGTSGTGVDINFRSRPDPPRTGDNEFEVAVKDAKGQPAGNADVTVQLFMPAMPTMNMPAMRNETTLPHVGGGVYRGRGQVIMAGRWDVTVVVGKDGKPLGRKQFALVAK